VATEQVTHGLLVPAVLQMVLAHPDVSSTDFSSLQRLVYGGSPISPELLAQGMDALGCDFMQLYGLTESTGLGTVLEPDDHMHDPQLLRSVGKPAVGVELRVVDPDTRTDVVTGDVGEVWLRSGSIMSGYWRNPEATEEVLVADGWLRTGDAGFLDANGYLFLHDRVKDMIVSGGENIYPADVERMLERHPGIAQAAVVPVDDEIKGTKPVAFVIAKAGHAPSEDEIKQFALANAPAYQHPRSVWFIDELPLASTNKVDRDALHRLAEERVTLSSVRQP
jgi:long-chain acyl-CoA synthetase